jgi:methylated-DNA-[protein]-cysteine S-methyltransferase
MPSTFATIPSQLGRIEIISDGEAITHLNIEGKAPSGHGRLQHGGKEGTPDAVIEQAHKELDEYFQGTRKEFDVPVKLVGTEFQQQVWHELLAINYGSHASYGEIATKIGKPVAARAVGAAVGANPVPIIIPCHRILAQDGKITGYSGGNGIPTKIVLLDREGISYRL